MAFQSLKPAVPHTTVACLHVEVLEGHWVGAEQLVGVRRHERHTEQATQVLRARPGRNLQDKR